MSFDGIILLNKKYGVSSNTAVNDVKWALKRQGKDIKKVGHAGTLDPNATGLLVVLINGATKLSDFLMLENKEYIAEITIGKSYDTDDVWGKIIEEYSLNENDFNEIKEKIDDVLHNLIGISKQIPPMYSSIKYHGRKLYEIAREGETIDISSKEREIEILELERVSDVKYVNETVVFSIRCLVSKGTYIRTLSKKIGECLGYPSAMSALVRSSSGDYKLENSCDIEDVKVGKYQMESMISSLKNIRLFNANLTVKDKCFHGKKVRLDGVKEDVVAICYENELIAIYERELNNIYKAKRVWN